MNEILHTKFGNAKIKKDGYYRITSGKEGNYRKLLHRLIWEDFYGCEVPEGYVIHHRNHIKTDNCILNLQLMRWSEHNKLHMTGKPKSEEHKQKMSESLTGRKLSDETKNKMSRVKNITGYLNVHKKNDETCKQGFMWCYQYYEDGKQKSFSSVSLEKLEQKVKAKGLKWEKL